MRNTSLKRTQRGYQRNLGRLPSGAQPKFYLGHNKDEAVARLDAIVLIWERVEQKWKGDPERAVWDEQSHNAAKLVAKGEPLVAHQGDYEPEDVYFARINEWRRNLRVPVIAANEFLFETGKQTLATNIKSTQQRLAQAIGSPTATGQSFHEALRGYQQHIRHEYRDSVDGSITDNGKKKLDQIDTIISYLPDLDLGALDFQGADEVFGVFRRRPISKRYKRPMAKKSCTNYIGELGRFFKWLHLSKDWQWRKPEDFELISRRARELDEDVEHEAKDTPVWTIDQLKILNEYATPIERVFLLLGLNCSYGADQAGRLRIGHLHLATKEDRHSFIKRVRRKKKTASIHILWKQTVEALQWALQRRESQTHETEFLLLTDNGRPYWSKTASGNRSQLIPNLWCRLLDRVQKDHTDFPRLPFNSLRDTSANMIRQMAGEETASLHLAHKHQSKDEHLRRYTHPVRKRHFKALLKLEMKLRLIFESAGPNPFADRQKNYIGRMKIKQILDLKTNGKSVGEIAKIVDISVPTVYRYLSPASASAISSDAMPCDLLVVNETDDVETGNRTSS